MRGTGCPTVQFLASFNIFEAESLACLASATWFHIEVLVTNIKRSKPGWTNLWSWQHSFSVLKALQLQDLTNKPILYTYYNLML
jgi:hypothetical protein